MKFARRIFLSAAVGAALSLSVPAFAQSAGTDFSPISPAQPTEDKNKIEVLEFFSYGCPHCFEFYPLLSAWVAKLPSDVVVRKVPVSFNSYFAIVAPLSYALEAMGEATRLDASVFKAIHVEGNRLADAKSRAEWAQKNGIDPQKLEDTMKSFGVMSKVKRAEQMTSAYHVQGVPALAVEGKYLVGGKDFNDALSIADKLIAKARAEKSGKK